MSEINVTPFVDVMLVLLIVFMVTAPLLTVGIPVDLPKINFSVVISKVFSSNNGNLCLRCEIELYLKKLDMLS